MWREPMWMKIRHCASILMAVALNFVVRFYGGYLRYISTQQGKKAGC